MINSAISLPDVLSFIYVEVIRIQICKTQRARMACFCEMFPLPRPQTEKYEKEKNTRGLASASCVVFREYMRRVTVHAYTLTV